MLGIMMAGHALVFLTAPADMERLLDASLDRLVLQLWPGFLIIYIYFQVVRSLEETAGSKETVQVFEVSPGRRVHGAARSPSLSGVRSP